MAQEETEAKKVDFDFNFTGRFSDVTVEDLEAARENAKHHYINTYFLRKLVNGNKVVLVINDDEPVIGGEHLLVTWGGFKLMNGQPLPCKVFRVIVDINEIFAITFTFAFNTHSNRMQMRVE